MASAPGIILFAGLLFAASEAVHKCEVEEKHWSAEHRQHPRPNWAMRFYRRVYVHSRCAAGADDVWVALSGIAVAGFTFTLWRSTNNLVKSAAISERGAKEQTEILNRQTRIVEKHNIVYGPVLGLADHKTAIKRNKNDEAIIKEIYITFVLKNYGQTSAVNVSYSMGEVSFIDYVESSQNEFNLIAERFQEKMAKFDTRRPGLLIPPDGIILTDQIVFTHNQLKALFNKEKMAFVWIIFVCESQLESSDWFAETAVFIEITMAGDPDNFRIVDTLTQVNNPMRIATRAQRYRHDHYKRPDSIAPSA